MDNIKPKPKFVFSEKSYKNLNNVDIRLQLVAKLALQKSSVDFGISSGFRTAEEQNVLFKQVPKVTNCDGYIKKSKHQSGRAVDVYAYVNGKANYEIENMELIAKAFKAAAFSLGINIEWGGDWKNFKDTPHFELKIL